MIPEQKIMIDFMDKDNKVKTFGIITGETPMGRELPEQENVQRTDKLRSYLQICQFLWFQTKGEYGTSEHPFLIYNCALGDMKMIGNTFDQESFIFAIVKPNADGSEVVFSCYQKNCQYIESKTESVKWDDITDDLFTSIGKKFNFTIPFDVFAKQVEDVNKLILERCNKHKEYLLSHERLISESISDDFAFNGRRLRRAQLYGTHYEKFIEPPMRTGSYNAIKTLAIFTAEDSNSQASANSENRSSQNSLYRDLKRSKYVIKNLTGNFGITKNPYMVLNIQLNTCKFLCGKYERTSFVFHRLLDDGTLMSEYWEKADVNKPYSKDGNDYIKKDETTEWIDMNNADDFYTIVGKTFKYQIPFHYLMECNRIINEDFEEKIEYLYKRGVVETKDNLMHMMMGVGQFPFRYRRSILKNLNSD